jgi:small subunit ribosomal protein S8
MNNSEKVAKSSVSIIGITRMIKGVLEILGKKGYVGKVEYEKNTRGGLVKVELINQINSCGAIKPRFNVKAKEIERFEQRYLPAKDFGLLILSTPKGLVTNQEAKEKKLGGKLIAYCY